MKNRVLSLLLALAMVIGMIVPAVYAEETETPEKTPAQIAAEIAAEANAMDFSKGGNIEARCPACDKVVTWKPLAGNTNGIGYVTTAGVHYYLTNDLISTGNASALHVTQSACLHLNGYDVDSRGATNTSGTALYSPAINVAPAADYEGTATLNVFGPSTGENPSILKGYPIGNQAYSPQGVTTPAGWTINIYGGKFVSSENATVTSPLIVMGSGAADATVNMYGGILDGNNVHVEGYPGVVQVANATAEFNMFDGTIQNGKSTTGCNVMVLAGAFNMHGGTITGGTTEDTGGNVYVLPSVSATTVPVFNMYGGEITLGVSESTSETKGGGNVAVGTRNGVVGRFNMYGGKISKGKATYGGNVRVIGGEFYMKDGTIEGFGTSAHNGNNYGANIHASSGVCTIDGGLLTNVYAQFRGGNIYTTGTATVTINGGIFSNSKASAGGNVAAYSTKPTTINGGTFSVSANTGSNIAVYGETTIYDATVTNGVIAKAKVSGAYGAAPTIHHGTYFNDPSEFKVADAVVVAGTDAYTVHKPEVKVATEATCTEPALSPHDGCAVCDMVLVDAQWVTREAADVITAPADTRTLVEQTSSTCTVAGNKAYYECSCGKFYEDAEAAEEIIDLAAWKAGDGALELDEHAYVYEYVSTTEHTVACESCETVFENGTHNTTAADCEDCGAKKIMLKIAGVQAPTNWTNSETAQIFTFGMWSGASNVDVAWNDPDSVYIELYSGETLLMTSAMKEGMYNGRALFVLVGTSARWETTLAEGVVLSEDTIPTKAVLYVDGVKNQEFKGANNATTGIFNEEQYKAYLQMPASGHVHNLDEGIEAPSASCTAPGELVKTCSVCDGTVKEAIEQKAHDYSGENGVCVNGCDKTVCENNGHAWGEEIEAKDETCIAKGNIAYYDCANCDAYAVGEEKVITAWNEIEIAINAEKHTGEAVLDETTVKQATCYESGYTGDKKCPGCKAVVEKGETTPTVAHTIKYKNITDTQHTAYCAVEACTVYEEVPADHVFENGECVCGKEEPAEDKGAQVGDTKYDTLQDALTAVAQTGGVVQLLKETAVEGNLYVPNNVTLDLAGQKLKVSGEEAYVLACYTNTFITDSSSDRSGRLVADISQLRMLDNNKQLPVKMTDGIMFVDATSGNQKKEGKNYQCWIDTADTQLIDALTNNNASELELEFQVVITWGNNVLKYTFKDTTVAEYLQNWQTHAMFLTITGAEGIDDLKYQARIVFADDTKGEVIVWAGQPVSHN